MAEGRRRAGCLRPSAFADHFSRQAAAHNTFRPAYPARLIADIVDHAPGRALAWDCATGSGQVALALDAHFARVIASDGSQAQIAQGSPSAARFVVALAERPPLRAGSVDLITVAQALHWFDLQPASGTTRGASSAPCPAL